MINMPLTSMSFLMPLNPRVLLIGMFLLVVMLKKYFSVGGNIIEVYTAGLT